MGTYDGGSGLEFFEIILF